MQTSEVLNKAADLIEEHGWGTGSVSAMGFGGLCVLGALYGAKNGGARPEVEDDAYYGTDLCPATASVFHYLRERDPFLDRPGDIWHWNDLIAGSASEVIEVLRACAVIEASREADVSTSVVPLSRERMPEEEVKR